MKKLTVNETEKEILIIALESIYHLELLSESDKETTKILLLALKKL